MTRKKKPVWEGTFKCPWCNNSNKVRVEDKVLSKAVPAERERFAVVEKDSQTTLDNLGKKKERRNKHGERKDRLE